MKEVCRPISRNFAGPISLHIGPDIPVWKILLTVLNFLCRVEDGPLSEAADLNGFFLLSATHVQSYSIYSAYVIS